LFDPITLANAYLPIMEFADSDRELAVALSISPQPAPKEEDGLWT
jgi:hypothetical protein